VDALRRIRPPVVRWPGGCFADCYHWRDGVGPRDKRPRTLNVHWGQVVEANEFGTHEFVRLCRAIGAEPYLCGNVGSGSPRELLEWVEYCNYPGASTLAQMRAENGSPDPFAVKFWGIGNENWGCGGNFTPEDYGGAYRRFATFVPALGGTQPFRIACGPAGNDKVWTRRFLRKVRADYWGGPGMEGLAAHYYCGSAGTDTEYSDDQWYELLHRAAAMDALIADQRAVMDEFDPERKVRLVVDEWGDWHPALPGRPLLWQQNTMRDALVAALTLDIFNRHADVVYMGNIAQTVNVLQSLVLTEGARMVVTPTCHVYGMYADHQGGQSVPLRVEADEIAFQCVGQQQRIFRLAGSASRKEDVLTVTLTNIHAREALDVRLRLDGEGRVQDARAEVLAHEDIHAHNTFDQPQAVMPRRERLEAPQARELAVRLQPASVTKLTLGLG